MDHFSPGVSGAQEATARAEIQAPFDRRVIGTIGLASADTVEQALFNATTLFNARAGWLAPARSIKVLNGTAHLLAERAEAFALGIALAGC